MSGMAITKWPAITIVLVHTVFSFSAAACEQNRLFASDANADDRLGVSVAIDGNTVVVGAYRNDSNGTDSGAAYVYELSGSDWIEKQKLTASDGAADDNFGRFVAIEGNTIVVGSHLDDNPGQDSGSAYVFSRSGDFWSQQQKLVALDSAAGDRFGFSISIDNNTIVVGAYGDNSETGAAYVFTKIGPTWSQQQKLTAADADAVDRFGYSVAIDNNTITVGAYRDDYSGYYDAGSAYVFTFDAQSWKQDAVLHASDPNDLDYFGYSVSLDGNSVVVGAYECDINGLSNVGAAYVFDKTGAGWVQRQKLLNTVNPNAGDDFGRSVAIEGDAILVGCPNYYFGDERTGTAFGFFRSGETWINQVLLSADDANAGDEFGFSVSLSGRRLIAGAHYSSDNGLYSGSAYVFTHPAGDLDRNCAVDFTDFAVLADSWLQNDPSVDIAPPPAGDGIVDIYDLALLCDNWLAGN